MIEPDDTFRNHALVMIETMKAKKDNPPFACCPKDNEPLVFTCEFKGAEFYCVVCKQTYGFLAPISRDRTVELEVRLAEHMVQYALEASQRRDGTFTQAGI